MLASKSGGHLSTHLEAPHRVPRRGTIRPRPRRPSSTGPALTAVGIRPRRLVVPLEKFARVFKVLAPPELAHIIRALLLRRAQEAVLVALAFPWCVIAGRR